MLSFISSLAVICVDGGIEQESGYVWHTICFFLLLSLAVIFADGTIEQVIGYVPYTKCCLLYHLLWSYLQTVLLSK